MHLDQMGAESAELLFADFAHDIVEQFQTNMRVVNACIFKSTLPTPEGFDVIDGIEQTGVSSSHSTYVQRLVRLMKPFDLRHD